MADELKSALDAAACAADVTWSRSQVAVAVHRHADRRRRLRRLATVSAAAALVAVSIGGALVLTSSDDEKLNVSIVDSTPDTSPPPDTDPATPATTVTTVTAATTAESTTSSVDTATTEPTPTVEPTIPVPASLEPTLRIENPPLSPRVNSVILLVLTGTGGAPEHIIDWGGQVPHDDDFTKPPLNDGAVWSRSTGEWTPMAPSPLPGGSATGAVARGFAVISNNGRAATYDVATNEWRLLENPLTDHPLASDELVTTNGTDVLFMQSDVAWNVPTGTWRALRSRGNVGASASARDVVTTNDTVVSIDAMIQGGLTVERYHIASDTWTTLPSPPGQHYGVGATVVTGNTLVIVSWWEMTAWSLDLATLKWTELPRIAAFPVKCEPTASSFGAIVIASMCGQLLLLDGDHWRPAIVGSVSSVFDVLELLPGQILIRGAVFQGGNGMNPMDAIIQWSPLRLAGLTVDGSLEPGSVTNVDNETITLDLVATGCSLSVSRGAAGDQQLFADAVTAAASSPESVTWWNPSGAYELACPSADSYAQSLVAMRTEGERTSARDAFGQFAGQGPWASAEEAANALATFVQTLYGDQDTVPAIGLGYFPDDPNTFTIESVGLADDSVNGQFFTITLQQNGDQWTIATATIADVCARGVTTTTDPSLCL